MDTIEKSILATMVYYDVLDRPLTAWEVFRYALQINNLSLQYGRVLEKLRNSSFLKQNMDQHHGMYFLKGRKSIIKERIERQKVADQKWKKVKRSAKFLQAIPYIRLVAVSGSLAINNTKKSSDIDLLIITQKGRIWTCRALVTLFFQLIGQRRHQQFTKDRFCLNHYITDNSLQLTSKSLYNAQTYAHLTPIIYTQKLINQFYQQNIWLKKYLIFYPRSWLGFTVQTPKSNLLNGLRQIGEAVFNTLLGGFLESVLKKFQYGRIAKDPLTYKAGGSVLFNDQQLAFHPDSPEKIILERFNTQAAAIGLPDIARQADSGLLT